MKHPETMFHEMKQVIVPVSGTIKLSFVEGLRGPHTFEAGLLYRGKVVDVCECEWDEMFSILEEVKHGIFARFTDFHQGMLEEWADA
jgi:hypothetical protein